MSVTLIPVSPFPDTRLSRIVLFEDASIKIPEPLFGRAVVPAGSVPIRLFWMTLPPPRVIRIPFPLNPPISSPWTVLPPPSRVNPSPVKGLTVDGVREIKGTPE